jgi:hypothetical protein
MYRIKFTWQMALFFVSVFFTENIFVLQLMGKFNAPLLSCLIPVVLALGIITIYAIVNYIVKLWLCHKIKGNLDGRKWWL